MPRPLVSICIPTYEMKGRGPEYLRHSFDRLVSQTFKDFEVVISDHSKTTVIQEVCSGYADKLIIQYIHNDRKVGSSSANINNAIRHAKGQLIKVLFQDDFLFG